MTFPHLSKDLEIFRNMIIFCSVSGGQEAIPYTNAEVNT